MNHEIGRPKHYTDQTEPMVGVTMRLTYWHVRAARRIGRGNVSEGVRLALEVAQQKPDELLSQPQRRDHVD